MAGLDAGPAIPVWLAEDDLGCIICHELLAWPATLPCGHSFCRGCLKGLWGAGRHWSCPTCREGAAQPLQLRKNTMLQDLADKYSLAARELEGPSPAPGPAPGPRRRPAQLPALSDGVDLSLASPKLTSSTPEGKMRDILHDLEGIQEKLQENFTWKEALEEQTPVELQESPSSSSCPLPDRSHLAPERTSSFARWAINPTFDLGSLSCSLEVSKDCRTVTVAHCPQPYPWSNDRFASCQALCSQALSSGQKYWEVDTQRCSHWAVGVACWEMRRDQILGRTRDSWCVEWKGASRLSAWHMATETVLGSDRPGVVGIWLDLEEGKLAFYSVADQAKLLYEGPVSASVPLHPAFWLYGLYPGNSLTIRQVNV
ncbi:E3 ubiquitin-protein ligase RNF135 isoform X3 [Hippopotamus amphibius kiboko]|uniref:E3 ubiquitin-protein ligase RNF135 isoform X3 n=1 Tax=Hippopotamus amphibius kiboko TaxID=575201 RepID=UPI002595970B|nr:E3 ubiquitin-protein ligase RNF135 isoform X3 [Hippopotamus amphibius kiboko]